MWYAKGVVEEEERGSDVGEMTKLSLSLPLLFSLRISITRPPLSVTTPPPQNHRKK